MYRSLTGAGDLVLVVQIRLIRFWRLTDGVRAVRVVFIAIVIIAAVAFRFFFRRYSSCVALYVFCIVGIINGLFRSQLTRLEAAIAGRILIVQLFFEHQTFLFQNNVSTGHTS